MRTTSALEAAAAGGLIQADLPLLVMLSGGADSVCLLDVAVKLGARTSALHVNYGLRPEADGDEQHCRALCDRLGVPLHVERVDLGGDEANVQARAREARYALAERVAEGDYAAAHTLSDQAETVLYRLASSPGRRALLGMPPRRGRLVRPLLEITRADTRAHCEAHGLQWREDTSNADPRFARSRIRHEVLPVLEEIAPGAERTIADTARLLREEAEVLDAAVDAALTDDLEAIAGLPPALAREVLRRLAGGPIGRDRLDAVLALAGRGGTAYVDVAGGLRAVVEYGRIRFTRAREEPRTPEPVELAVPGRAAFGEWRIEAGIAEGGGHKAEEADLDRAALGDSVLVRSWRAGDRMRPVGLGGTKTLQDLFTDRKVPRAERPLVPVLEVAGEIAWVPGVAVGERFAARDGARVVGLRASLAPR
jgi:tRNA(Ile)-lysidine synthase